MTLCGINASAQNAVDRDSGDVRFDLDYEAEAIFAVGGNNFAPYYIVSNRNGILTQSKDAIVRASLSHDMDMHRRFSYGFGAEIVAGATSAVDYGRWDAAVSGWSVNRQRPSAFWLQQLYGEVKYRALFAEVGMKEHSSRLLTSDLASGDLVESGNARPIPQVRVGFNDFVDIPLTNGWLQIDGVISYGKFTDNGWMKSHFNYYNWHINLGGLYTYKRCYFRTKPGEAFSATFGMQTAGMFGGTTSTYRQGNMTSQRTWSRSIGTFFKMFLPVRGKGSEYYEGNSLGSWDILLRYRFNDGTQLRAYLQKPFEDGSGIGWLNGFDGVWGLEYIAPSADAFVSGALIEYVDFTNQSGPIHWAPDDAPGTTLVSHTDGGDQYYNNFASNSYMNYGMGIGTPFLPAPIYNLDGYMGYVHNRIRGFHAGVKGRIVKGIDYRLLGSYRKGWGDSRLPVVNAVHNTSLMIEGNWHPERIAGLGIKLQIAYDGGNMSISNGWGVALGVTYSGKIRF